MSEWKSKIRSVGAPLLGRAGPITEADLEPYRNNMAQAVNADTLKKMMLVESLGPWGAMTDAERAAIYQAAPGPPRPTE